MPRNCGCISDRCVCLVTAGEGASVTGTGSSTTPYIVDMFGGGTKVEVVDTPTVNLTLADGGDGSIIAPYILTGTALGIPASGTDVQVFNGNGTWTRPEGTTMLRVIATGGGGGGGGGGYNAAVGVVYGGNGGGGGGYVDVTMPIPQVQTLDVRVGSGGAGGALNVPGGDGAPSEIGPAGAAVLRVGGGKGGTQVVITTRSPVTPGGAGSPSGGQGGNGADPTPGVGGLQPTGGGGGAWRDNVNGVTHSEWVAGGAQPATARAGSAAGVAGAAGATAGGGLGGGGGVAAGAGGAGGTPGGGGGGGGSDGATAGVGGNGAPGRIVLVSW